MRVYISGAISSDPNYREKFSRIKEQLESKGFEVITPTILPEGLTQEQYLHVDYALIDICEGVYFMKDWKTSPGANKEHLYARLREKIIEHEV